MDTQPAVPEVVLPLGLLPIMTFMALVGNLPKKSHDDNRLVYEFTFKNGEHPSIFAPVDVTATPFLDLKEQGKLVQDYTQVIMGITLLIALDFKVRHLTLIDAASFSGVSISFVSPKGQLYTHQYVRDAKTNDVIPADFMHDLMHFPKRYPAT